MDWAGLFVFLHFLLFMVNPEINAKAEQHVNLKFLCKSGATPIECWWKLQQVWGDRTMSKTQVRVWHRWFKDGAETVSDMPQPGRLRTAQTDENIQMIQGMIQGDGSLSISEMAHHTGISHPIIRRIVRQDLNLRRKCAKFVP